MQSHSRESYFILPAEKQPTPKVSQVPLLKWALILMLMIVMALVALSLGLWWDSVSPVNFRG
jgi:hypothetical protein